MATASIRRPLPAAADLASQQRRTLPFSSVFHQVGTPPDPSSPTNSVGSTGGLIYRDQRDLAMDLLNMMPTTLRDSSPAGQQQQQQSNNQNNSAYPRGNRVAPPSMGEGELDPPTANGISPAGSLRRIPRENRGSSGSINEMGIPPQDLAAVGAARERDRPDSRDRERRDRDKNPGLPVDKQEARRTPTDTRGAGVGQNRPSPYTFDSTSTIKPANHSATDLLSMGNPRDSPSYDTNGLASLDPLQGDSGAPSMQKRQGSGDTLDLPNGEHGGWVSYSESSELGPQPQRQEARNADWDRKQANQAYSASRFSPDRFPLTEEQDGRDEEILSIPRGTTQQTRSIQPPQQTQPSQPAQPRRRDLPIPGQSTQAMLHSRDHNGTSQPIIPVPKTQHAQVIQSQQWIRRPSSPLAREPVVQAQNTSSEESDSYTPRSPHATLPEIPSISPTYPPNPTQQVQQQYQQQPAHPSPSNQQNQHLHHPHQQQANTRPMPPPALVNRPRPNNQPMFEQHRGMPAMQLPMYTGASMATALSSISPSQSVSAVGSPHPQSRLPPGPPFGPSSSVFIPEAGRNGKHSQMYPHLQQQQGMGSKNQSQRGSGLGYSLDQQIAALTGQNYPVLNSSNLAALKSLTANDLRAMGFGQPQPAQPLRTPKVEPRGTSSQRRVVETLDKAAGEVVELQDLQRAMEMNLDQWDGRDWQGHHRPAHTGNSAQYPSSHAVLPPGDRAKQKAAEEYEHQLQQLAAMGINMNQQNGAYSSSSHLHQRPGNPIPPTPFSATSGQQGPQFPHVIPNGAEGWIPVPNTDGYPPSYGEILSLYEQHNPGRQPTTRDVLLMQLAALASEPENMEGSVFSKSETPFPPIGYNPFIQSQAPRPGDSARSSPRDPPGEFDKMLRRVGTFNQPPRRTVGSSVFGGDGETEVSRMAPSTATEGGGPEDEGETTEEDTRSNETAGLRLNFDNSTTDTLNTMGMQNAINNANNNEGHSNIHDLYPLIGILKSRAASVAPSAFLQQQHQQQQQQQQLANINQNQTNDPWVEETDSDEDLEADLEVWGEEEGAVLHPRFIRDEAKRRRKWEIKFAELVKAFHELDRLTDTPMILLATPPRSHANGPNTQPVSHLALSRSIKRDQAYTQRAHEARQSYHNILITPPTSRATSYQSASSPNMSPPIWGGPRLGHGWSSGSAASASDADSQMRAQMVAALGSLRLMSKVEERREDRRRQEAIRQKDEREAVERMLKGLLSGAANSAAGSQGNAGSVSAGSPAGGSVRGGSVRADSVGVPAPAEDLTPQATGPDHD